MDKKANLASAYALQTPDDSRQLYAAWAKTYESEFIAASGYCLHAAVADAFATAGGTGPVLDMGAGTGICGVSLAALGVQPIDATDISPEMLSEAADKGCYSELFEGDILAGLPKDDGAYQGIVSSGTFTLGHVGPEGLDEVLRLLAPGGLAVISVRDAHFEAEGFESKIASLEPLLRKSSRARARVYANSVTHAHKNDIAFLLHLWKR